MEATRLKKAIEGEIKLNETARDTGKRWCHLEKDEEVGKDSKST